MHKGERVTCSHGFHERRGAGYICHMNVPDALRQAFAAPLPGWEAQARMLNYLRPQAHEAMRQDPEARPGAVLVLIYPRNGLLHTVLTLRHAYKGAHSAQVSFPGGKPEPGDRDMWHTALREAREEVGLRQMVEQVGTLTQVYIPPSRFLVSPFVGYCPEPPRWEAEEKEVAKIIEAPLSLFMDERNIGETSMHVQVVNARVKVKYFAVQEEIVWGATAMMLNELAEVLRRSGMKLTTT